MFRGLWTALHQALGHAVVDEVVMNLVSRSGSYRAERMVLP